MVKKEVNVEKSSIEWSGSKITGASHKGTISVSSGYVELGEGKPVGGEVVVDMKSIASSDLEGEMAEKLVGHLTSPDFFDVENHPTATFSLTSVEDGKVKGNLTIKGTSKEISFPLDNENLGEVTLELDRTEWDIRYGSGKFFKGLGDKVIKDEFSVKVKLVLE